MRQLLPKYVIRYASLHGEAFEVGSDHRQSVPLTLSPGGLVTSHPTSPHFLQLYSFRLCASCTSYPSSR